MRVVHLARKPLSEPTIAGNVLKHGTGALHIEAGRVPSDGSHKVAYQPGRRTALPGDVREGAALGMFEPGRGFMPTNAEGRWPANLILNHLSGCRAESLPGGLAQWTCEKGCPAAELDADAGAVSQFFIQVGGKLG